MNLSISLGRETKALCGRKITAISIILQPYVVIRYFPYRSKLLTVGTSKKPSATR